LGGCGSIPTTGQTVFDSGGAVQSRVREERAFDTADRNRTLRAVLVTLQECGFVVDNADASLGIITATKLDTYTLRATVTVRPRGSGQMAVRVNAQHSLPGQSGGARPLNDPAAYQDFFTALAKNLFLGAQEVR
jgi:hypothetical protein